jgi:hypothetical protein
MPGANGINNSHAIIKAPVATKRRTDKPLFGLAVATALVCLSISSAFVVRGNNVMSACSFRLQVRLQLSITGILHTGQRSIRSQENQAMYVIGRFVCECREMPVG